MLPSPRLFIEIVYPEQGPEIQPAQCNVTNSEMKLESSPPSQVDVPQIAKPCTKQYALDVTILQPNLTFSTTRRKDCQSRR